MNELRSAEVTPILMYHKVAPVNPRSTLRGHYVSPRLFRRQMEWLADRGYQPITLSAAMEPDAPPRRIVLTFDDGYENFFVHALPILVRLGFSATVFLVADRLGGINEWDVSHGDVPERLMSVPQLQEAIHAGIELGSHTLDHADLAAASPKEAWHQIALSREVLQEALGEAIESFCYPYGRHTDPVRRMVERAGYRQACGTSKGPNLPDTDRYDLRRVNVRRNTAVPILRYKLRRDLAIER